MKVSRHDLPRARNSDLVIREIPGELLVYDLKCHKAFCLNESAAAIWKSCNGKRTVPELARKLGNGGQTPVDERVVWLALDQLEKSNLLLEKISYPAKVSRVSRRDLIRIGVVGAITLPLITVITAPVAAQAGTPITTSACNARNQPNCGGNPCTGGAPGSRCLPKGLTACDCR